MFAEVMIYLIQFSKFNLDYIFISGVKINITNGFQTRPDNIVNN